jgi:hypothetical protein
VRMNKKYPPHDISVRGVSDRSVRMRARLSIGARSELNDVDSGPTCSIDRAAEIWPGFGQIRLTRRRRPEHAMLKDEADVMG